MDVTGMRAREEAAMITVDSGSNSPSSKVRKEVTKGMAGSKVSNPVSINLNGADEVFPQSAVQNAKEGERNKYRFKDVSEEGIAKSRLLDCISQDDVKDIEEEGMSLEKYESERLERAIERIKSQRAEKKESVERFTERKKKELESVKKASLRSRLSGNVPDYLVERMVAEDVPVTEENVNRAMKACELANSVTDLTEGSIRYLLENELRPTIRNLYHAKFSGIQTENPERLDVEWGVIKDQAGKRLQEDGYKWNEESQEKARWLFRNGLPVTGETMRDYDALLAIREDNEEGKNIDRIVEAMAEGMDPEWASLDGSEGDVAEQVVKDFKEVDEESIRHVLNNRQKMNLNNLREAGRHISKQKEDSGNESVQSYNDVEVNNGLKMNNDGMMNHEVKIVDDIHNDVKMVDNVEFITEKRRLEEIRLKMTLQSAKTLLKNGIHINTAPLEELVEELRELENRYYKDRFAEAGEWGEESEIDLLKETTETVNKLYHAPVYVLGARFQEGGTHTIRSLAEDSEVLRNRLNLAGEAYETLMTVPRKDMGDSIQKAFRNVDAILDDLGYEKNEANQRAVRILGYNEIEINEENISRMKEADAKVSYLLNNLHPAVTVKLIKEDVNPLNMPIDELNEKIRAWRNELGISEEERFSKYLWQLERKEGIAEEERESYIGIYRMLNQIQNMDGAAVGALVEANGELTLNHLMTAVRTLKSGGLKAKVDDEFGATLSVGRKTKTITEQASTAFGNRTHIHNMADDALERITPDKWKSLLEENQQDVGRLTLETIQEKLSQMEEESEEQNEYYREMAERARDVFSHSEEEIGFLKSNRLPVTMYHIAAVRQMSSEGRNIVKRILEQKEEWEEKDILRLKEESDGLLDSIGDREALREQDAKVRDVVLEVLNKRKQEVSSYEEMRRICTLEGEIRLRAMLSEREKYEIPLVTEEGVTNVSLTVIRNGKDKGRLHVDMDSPLLGRITTDFTVKGRRVQGTVFCANEDIGNLVNESGMEERIRADGYELIALNEGRGTMGNARWELSPEEDDATDTKALYRLAKNVIQSIHALEKGLGNEANIERNVAL